MKTLRLTLLAVLAVVAAAGLTAQADNSDRNEVYSLGEVGVKPEYPGGEEAMYAFIDTSLNYPEIAAALANVVINADGSLSDTKVLRSSDEAFCLAVKRLIASMPAWSPAQIDGKPVKASYAIPVIFCPSPTNCVDDSVKINDKAVKEITYEVDSVDEKPEFPGGEKAMYEYLCANVHYPVKNPEEVIQGIVVVQFTIDKDGNTSDLKAVRSPHKCLTREVMRVVLMMPKWTPGKKNGKAVNVNYILPIKFKLGT